MANGFLNAMSINFSREDDERAELSGDLAMV